VEVVGQVYGNVLTPGHVPRTAPNKPAENTCESVPETLFFVFKAERLCMHKEMHGQTSRPTES
jgi:hypothetical protein